MTSTNFDLNGLSEILAEVTANVERALAEKLNKEAAGIYEGETAFLCLTKKDVKGLPQSLIDSFYQYSGNVRKWKYIAKVQVTAYCNPNRARDAIRIYRVFWDKKGYNIQGIADNLEAAKALFLNAAREVINYGLADQLSTKGDKYAKASL